MPETMRWMDRKILTASSQPLLPWTADRNCPTRTSIISGQSTALGVYQKRMIRDSLPIILASDRDVRPWGKKVSEQVLHTLILGLQQRADI